MAEPKGLYQKYILQHTNGDPIDPEALYFVLRYDGVRDFDQAAREVLWSLAKKIEGFSPELSADLKKSIEEIGSWRVFTDDVETWVAMDLADLPDAVMDLQKLSNALSEATDCKKIDVAPDFADNFYEIDPDSEIAIKWDEFEEMRMPLPHNGIKQFVDNESIVVAKARDWARWNGRGFLCSTEG